MLESPGESLCRSQKQKLKRRLRFDTWTISFKAELILYILSVKSTLQIHTKGTSSFDSSKSTVILSTRHKNAINEETRPAYAMRGLEDIESVAFQWKESITEYGRSETKDTRVMFMCI